MGKGSTVNKTGVSEEILLKVKDKFIINPHYFVYYGDFACPLTAMGAPNVN